MAQHQQNSSLDVLKKAFNEGYEAFKVVIQNSKGFYNNPSNPYQPKSLLFKDWERGFQRGYWEQQKANKVAGV